MVAPDVDVHADSVEDLRQAEIGFARAFAQRDREKFFSYVADDALFASDASVIQGKENVVARWSKFFDDVSAPFSWGPEQIAMTSQETIGLSTGPVYAANGEYLGLYSSIWRRNSAGVWQVTINGPLGRPVALPENIATTAEGFVTAPDGARLYYRRIGQGPVTLIAPLDAGLHRTLRQFADVATIITYDMRNRGRSSKVDIKTLSVQQDAADMEAVRAHFKIDKFIPVGHSYLGKVVAIYAARYPSRVARLIQLSPLANRPSDHPAASPPAGVRMPPEVLQEWNVLRTGNGETEKPQAHCEAFWRLMSYYSLAGNPEHASRFDYKSLCTHENEWLMNFNPTMATLATTWAAALSTQELQEIDMPVLVVHGTKDWGTPYSGGRAWAAAVPNGRIVTVTGGGHVPWLDDPVVVFAAIRRFIAGEWPLDSEEAK